jgi:hypothetical protein
MAGLSMHRGAAEYITKVVSAPIDFIGQFLFLSRHTLKGTVLSAQKMAIILNGVAAAGLALHNLSIACCRSNFAEAGAGDRTLSLPGRSASLTSRPHSKQQHQATTQANPVPRISSFAQPLIQTVLERDIPTMITFFIDLLADKQSELSPALRELQLYVCVCVLTGYDGYAELLNSVCLVDPSMEDLLLQLSPGGIAVCDVMKQLHSVFGEDRLPAVLDRLCAILAKLTKPKVLT